VNEGHPDKLCDQAYLWAAVAGEVGCIIFYNRYDGDMMGYIMGYIMGYTTNN